MGSSGEIKTKRDTIRKTAWINDKLPTGNPRKEKKRRRRYTFHAWRHRATGTVRMTRLSVACTLTHSIHNIQSDAS